jgi:hypothetical protein
MWWQMAGRMAWRIDALLGSLDGNQDDLVACLLP